MAIDASTARHGNVSTQQLGHNAAGSMQDSPNGNTSHGQSPSGPQNSQQQGTTPDSNQTSEGHRGEILIGYLRHTRSVLDDPVSDEESEDIQLPIQGVRKDDAKPQEQGDANSPSNDKGSEQQPHIRGGWDLDDEQPGEDYSFPQQNGFPIPTPNPHERTHDEFSCCCRVLKDWLISQLISEAWTQGLDDFSLESTILRGGSGGSDPSQSGNSSSSPIDIPRQGGSSSNQGRNSHEHGPYHPGGPHRDPSPLATYAGQDLSHPPRQQWTFNQGNSSQSNSNRDRGGGIEPWRLCDFCGNSNEEDEAYERRQSCPFCEIANEEVAYELDEGITRPTMMQPEPYTRRLYARIDPPVPARYRAISNEAETEAHGDYSGEPEENSWRLSEGLETDGTIDLDHQARHAFAYSNTTPRARDLTVANRTDNHAESSTGERIASHGDQTTHEIDRSIRNEEQLQQEMDTLGSTRSNNHLFTDQSMKQEEEVQHPGAAPRHHKRRPSNSKNPIRSRDLRRYAVMNRLASNSRLGASNLPPIPEEIISGPLQQRESGNAPIMGTSSAANLASRDEGENANSDPALIDKPPETSLRGGGHCDGCLGCLGRIFCVPSNQQRGREQHPSRQAQHGTLTSSGPRPSQASQDNTQSGGRSTRYRRSDLPRGVSRQDQDEGRRVREGIELGAVQEPVAQPQTLALPHSAPSSNRQQTSQQPSSQHPSSSPLRTESSPFNRSRFEQSQCRETQSDLDTFQQAERAGLPVDEIAEGYLAQNAHEEPERGQEPSGERAEQSTQSGTASNGGATATPSQSRVPGVSEEDEEQDDIARKYIESQGRSGN